MGCAVGSFISYPKNFLSGGMLVRSGGHLCHDFESVMVLRVVDECHEINVTG